MNGWRATAAAAVIIASAAMPTAPASAAAPILGSGSTRVGNAAGLFRLPDAGSVATALLDATENADGTQNLTGVHLNPRQEAYPISSYTYLVIPTSDDFPAEKGETLSRYLIHSVTTGQAKADAARLRTAAGPPRAARPRPRRVDNGHVEPSPPSTGVYVAEYAEATFAKRGAQLRVAPGEVDDGGTVSEELEIDLTQTSCSARTLTTTEVTARLAAPEIDGVVVDARAGSAQVAGTYALDGTRTTVPAGRNCTSPVAGEEQTVPIESPSRSMPCGATSAAIGARGLLRRRLRGRRRVLLAERNRPGELGNAHRQVARPGRLRVLLRGDLHRGRGPSGGDRMKRLALIAVAASLFLRVAAGSGSVDAAAPILGSGSTFAEVALDAWAGDLLRRDRLHRHVYRDGLARRPRQLPAGHRRLRLVGRPVATHPHRPAPTPTRRSSPAARR